MSSSLASQNSVQSEVCVCILESYPLFFSLESTPGKHTHTLHFGLNFGRQGKSSLIPHSQTIMHPESNLLDIKGVEMASHGMNQGNRMNFCY